MESPGYPLSPRCALEDSQGRLGRVRWSSRGSDWGIRGMGMPIPYGISMEALQKRA